MFDESKGIPPFKWSTSGWEKPIGQPDLFNFTPFWLDWDKEEWANDPFKNSKRMRKTEL